MKELFHARFLQHSLHHHQDAVQIEESVLSKKCLFTYTHVAKCMKQSFHGACSCSTRTASLHQHATMHPTSQHTYTAKKKFNLYFNSTYQTVKKKKSVKTKKLPGAGSDTSALPLSSCKAPNPQDLKGLEPVGPEGRWLPRAKSSLSLSCCALSATSGRFSRVFTRIFIFLAYFMIRAKIHQNVTLERPLLLEITKKRSVDGH